MYVHRHRRRRYSLECHRVRSNCEHTEFAQPFRAINLRTRTRRLRSLSAGDVTRRIVPEARPTRAQQNDIALFEWKLSAEWQPRSRCCGVIAKSVGNVSIFTCAAISSITARRKWARWCLPITHECRRIALNRSDIQSAVQLSTARKNGRARRCACPRGCRARLNRLRSSCRFPLRNLRVFGKSEQEWRMRGEVRHSTKVRLREIVQLGPANRIQQFVGQRLRSALPDAGLDFLCRSRCLAGITGASFAAQRPSRYCRS